VYTPLFWRRWIRFFSTAIVMETVSKGTHSLVGALIEYVSERSLYVIVRYQGLYVRDV